MKQIDRRTLETMLLDSDPPALLEALPPKYFRQGHLPGARQLNTDGAADHAKRLGMTVDQPIVVYCASETCANSHQAAEALAAAGYRDVSVYAGGKQDWVDAGLPLEGAVAAA